MLDAKDAREVNNTTEPQTVAELIPMITHPMFADRATLDEAHNYFFTVMKSINDADRVAAMTATFVLINTVARKLNDINNINERGDLYE